MAAEYAVESLCSMASNPNIFKVSWMVKYG